MKSKIVFLISISVFFSCATKPFVTDNSVSNTIESKHSKDLVTEELPTNPKTLILTKELLESKTLYENSCSKCHKLYEPSEFNKSEWPSILHSMQKKAKLDDNQVVRLLDYINSQI